MSEAKTTPQSSYTGPIVVDPLTRIEGHLRIEVEVENGRVKDARSCSTLFRGLETILKGRDPRDARSSPPVPAACAPIPMPWRPPVLWKTPCRLKFPATPR